MSDSAKTDANGLTTSSVNGNVPLSCTYSSSSLSSTSSSPSSSLSSSTSPPNGMNYQSKVRFQPFAQKGMVKSVSIHKFLSSKNRCATSNSSSSFANTFTTSSDANYSGDLRPPIMVKGGLRRGSVSAETKIQEELKEMKAREEELRRQRARLMGRSQPNLTNMPDNDENTDQSCNNYHSNGNGNDAEADNLKRTSSNPDMVSNIEIQKKSATSPLSNGFKHRNPLIAQWQEKINKNKR